MNHKKHRQYRYKKRTGRPPNDHFIGQIVAKEWKVVENVSTLRRKGHGTYYLLRNINTGKEITIRSDYVMKFKGHANKVSLR